MAYFLALDAGGTKTDYLLANETGVLARVRGGTIKRMRTDAQSAVLHLETALREVQAQSGVDLRSVQRTCVGAAGNTVPMVTDFLRAELGARVGGELLLLGDVEIALDAAFPCGSGVLVLAGTGSNVAGRTRSGKILTAGGWGPALADQGSGHRIGHQALRAICQAQDEERPTAMLDAVLKFWNLRSMEELVEFANRLPPPDFSALTHVVCRCAACDDEVAVEVLQNEGRELGSLVCTLIRRLQAAGDAPEAAPRVAFAGSIMERVQPVRAALGETIRAAFPKAEMLPGVVDPIEGALWQARSGHRFATAASS